MATPLLLLAIFLCVPLALSVNITSEEMISYTFDNTCDLFTDTEDNQKCKSDKKGAKQSLDGLLGIIQKDFKGLTKNASNPKTFGDTLGGIHVHDYGCRFCMNVVDEKAHEECQKVGRGAVAVFANLFANDTIRNKFVSITEEIIVQPASISWATREFIRLYLHACNQEADEKVRKACNDGAESATPSLIKSMIEGNLFQKVATEYKEEKKKGRKRRWVFYVLAAAAASTVVGAAVLGGAIYGTAKLVKVISQG